MESKDSIVSDSEWSVFKINMKEKLVFHSVRVLTERMVPHSIQIKSFTLYCPS